MNRSRSSLKLYSKLQRQNTNKHINSKSFADTRKFNDDNVRYSDEESLSRLTPLLTKIFLGKSSINFNKIYKDDGKIYVKLQLNDTLESGQHISNIYKLNSNSVEFTQQFAKPMIIEKKRNKINEIQGRELHIVKKLKLNQKRSRNVKSKGGSLKDNRNKKQKVINWDKIRSKRCFGLNKKSDDIQKILSKDDFITYLTDIFLGRCRISLGDITNENGKTYLKFEVIKSNKFAKHCNTLNSTKRNVKTIRRKSKYLHQTVKRPSHLHKKVNERKPPKKSLLKNVLTIRSDKKPYHSMNTFTHRFVKPPERLSKSFLRPGTFLLPKVLKVPDYESVFVEEKNTLLDPVMKFVSYDNSLLDSNFMKPTLSSTESLDQPYVMKVNSKEAGDVVF